MSIISNRLFAFLVIPFYVIAVGLIFVFSCEVIELMQRACPLLIIAEQCPKESYGICIPPFPGKVFRPDMFAIGELVNGNHSAFLVIPCIFTIKSLYFAVIFFGAESNFQLAMQPVVIAITYGENVFAMRKIVVAIIRGARGIV